MKNTDKLMVVKVAGLVGDELRGVPGHVLGTVLTGGLVPFSMIGELAGLADDGSREEVEEGNRKGSLAFLPAVAGYRRGRRLKAVTRRSKELGAQAPQANLAAEYLGIIPTTVATTLLGASIGDKPGAAIGAVAPLGIAGLVALARKRRTEEEQAASDTTGRAIAKYFIPGLAGYDWAKRVGVSRGWDKEQAEAKRKSRDEKNEGKSAAYKWDRTGKGALVGAGLASLFPLLTGYGDRLSEFETPAQRRRRLAKWILLGAGAGGSVGLLGDVHRIATEPTGH